MVDAIADRAFIATAQGRIGYTRPSVQPGDSVCVSQNSIVPFIVRNRPEGGPDMLIGEAYVSGIMHGEAMEMNGQHDTALVDVELA